MIAAIYIAPWKCGLVIWLAIAAWCVWDDHRLRVKRRRERERRRRIQAWL